MVRHVPYSLALAAFVFPSLSISLRVCVFPPPLLIYLCLCVSLPHSQSLKTSLHLIYTSLTIPPYITLYLSPSPLSLCWSPLPFFIPHNLSLSLSICVCVCVSLPPSLTTSLSLYLCVCVSLFHSSSLITSLHLLYTSLTIPPSITLSLSLSPSLLLPSLSSASFSKVANKWVIFSHCGLLSFLLYVSKTYLNLNQNTFKHNTRWRPKPISA